MKRKIKVLIILFLTSCNLNASAISSFSDTTKKDFYPVRERMITKSLNGTWKFKIVEGLSIPAEYSGWENPEFDVNQWDNIIVPGNWETQGFKMPTAWMKCPHPERRIFMVILVLTVITDTATASVMAGRRGQQRG